MTIIVAPATHAVRNLQHNTSHTSHCKLQLYHITSCKNKLDASNTFARLRGSMVTKQTVATYVTIEHHDHDSYFCLIRGACSRDYK